MLIDIFGVYESQDYNIHIKYQLSLHLQFFKIDQIQIGRQLYKAVNITHGVRNAILRSTLIDSFFAFFTNWVQYTSRLTSCETLLLILRISSAQSSKIAESFLFFMFCDLFLQKLHVSVSNSGKIDTLWQQWTKSAVLYAERLISITFWGRFQRGFATWSEQLKAVKSKHALERSTAIATALKPIECGSFLVSFNCFNCL